jgi:hypothetical protein
LPNAIFQYSIEITASEGCAGEIHADEIPFQYSIEITSLPERQWRAGFTTSFQYSIEITNTTRVR